MPVLSALTRLHRQAMSLLAVFILALSALLASAPAVAAEIPAAPFDLRSYRSNVGEVFQFRLTANAFNDCGVWGTDIYTDDSCLRRAAIHAGVLADGETGIITVRILPGQPSYASSTRNGITTDAWGSY